jgi:hypothetical protein
MIDVHVQPLLTLPLRWLLQEGCEAAAERGAAYGWPGLCGASPGPQDTGVNVGEYNASQPRAQVRGADGCAVGTDRSAHTAEQREYQSSLHSRAAPMLGSYLFNRVLV